MAQRNYPIVGSSLNEASKEWDLLVTPTCLVLSSQNTGGCCGVQEDYRPPGTHGSDFRQRNILEQLRLQGTGMKLKVKEGLGQLCI